MKTSSRIATWALRRRVDCFAAPSPDVLRDLAVVQTQEPTAVPAATTPVASANWAKVLESTRRFGKKLQSANGNALSPSE